MADVVCFFGAGASAPFGIPTMQGMVEEFDKTLQGEDKAEERALYQDIRQFLTATLNRPVDLEAVFTIVDSITNWSVDRMGIAALYHAMRASAAERGWTMSSLQPPTPDIARIAQSVRDHFEKFVQKACQIPAGQSAKIDSVYKTFFDRISSGGYVISGRGGRNHVGLGPMFTTNYDAVLEHYWLDIFQTPLNTGFQYDVVARMDLSNPELLRQDNPGGPLRLFKLHGSITWLRDERWGLTEQRVPPQEMMTYTGRKFLGQMMLYPIEEKDLFVEPYQTMYLMLNRELAAATRWIVVGYSFGDRIVRDIFIENSRKETNLTLLLPHATKVAERLRGFKGSIRPLDARFGEDDFARVAQAL